MPRQRVLRQIRALPWHGAVRLPDVLVLDALNPAGGRAGLGIGLVICAHDPSSCSGNPPAGTRLRGGTGGYTSTQRQCTEAMPGRPRSSSTRRSAASVPTSARYFTSYSI